MTQFGPIRPHDGGPKPVWLEDETPVCWYASQDFNGGIDTLAGTLMWRPNITACQIPIDHWANAPLAAGMTPWPGGDEAPGDWDGGPVMVNWGKGEIETMPYVGIPLNWTHDGQPGQNHAHIIGYTPRRATVTEPAPDPMAALNERAWGVLKEIVKSHSHFQDGTWPWLDNARATMADRAKLTVDPDVLVVREELAKAYEASGSPLMAQLARTGEYDTDTDMTTALACYRLGKETAK